MTETLWMGPHGGYADEVTFARHEGAARLAAAIKTRTLDWAARLVYHVVYPGCDAYVTDPVDVYRLTRDHAEASVEVMPVRRR
ncbi:MAG: hypothetical protein NXI21_07290 [Alphaproteobacteria bacterium]|nr:hypothetical protein [Alphaproteobacteria bacterium]